MNKKSLFVSLLLLLLNVPQISLSTIPKNVLQKIEQRERLVQCISFEYRIRFGANAPYFNERGEESRVTKGRVIFFSGGGKRLELEKSLGEPSNQIYLWDGKKSYTVIPAPSTRSDKGPDIQVRSSMSRYLKMHYTPDGFFMGLPLTQETLASVANDSETTCTYEGNYVILEKNLFVPEKIYRIYLDSTKNYSIQKIDFITNNELLVSHVVTDFDKILIEGNEIYIPKMIELQWAANMNQNLEAWKDQMTIEDYSVNQECSEDILIPSDYDRYDLWDIDLKIGSRVGYMSKQENEDFMAVEADVLSRLDDSESIEAEDSIITPQTEMEVVEPDAKVESKGDPVQTPVQDE